MNELEKVIKGMECCAHVENCNDCPFDIKGGDDRDEYGLTCISNLIVAAREAMKAQEARHKLEIHNIGNVDIPEGVTREQFDAVMNNIVEALEYAERGKGWPYANEEGDNDKWKMSGRLTSLKRKSRRCRKK